MGIRFFCPSGHRLHVKTFLAGKKGICPECGVKLQVPSTSDPRAERGDSAGDQPQPVAVSDDAVSTLTTEPEGRATATPKREGKQASQPGVANKVTTAKRPPPAPKVPPPALADEDPIAKAGSAVWYVRHPDGSQYGPAEQTTMRQWVAEGRVGPDSMVWHEGWSDWEIAGKVFPKLSKGTDDLSRNNRQSTEPPPATNATGQAEVVARELAIDSAMADSPEIGPTDPSVSLAMQRKIRRQRSVMWLGVLIVIALSLGVVALYVLFR